MRRLDGVTHVQLDTVDQIACIFIEEPTELDFEDFIDAAVDAAYKTVEMRIYAKGTIERSACDDCGSVKNFFKLDGTNQKFEIDRDEFNAGERIQLKAKVIGWDNEHPLLVPID